MEEKKSNPLLDELKRFNQSLIGQRIKKHVLKHHYKVLLGKKVTMEEDKTDEFFNLFFTTATEPMQRHGFIDIEVLYLKTPNRDEIYVAEIEILNFEE